MTIELPEAKGTYILLASLSQAKRLEIGRLGPFDLVPGFSWFRQQMAERFEPGIRPQVVSIKAPTFTGSSSL